MELAQTRAPVDSTGQSQAESPPQAYASLTLVELVELKDAVKSEVLSRKAQHAPPDEIEPVHAKYRQLSALVAQRKAFDATAAFKLLDPQRTGSVSADAFVAAALAMGPSWIDGRLAAGVFESIAARAGRPTSAPLPREAFKAWWIALDARDRTGEALKLALANSLHGVPPSPVPLTRAGVVAKKQALKEQLAALRAARASAERILPVYLKYKEYADLAESAEPAGWNDTSAASSSRPRRADGISAVFDESRLSLAVYFPYFVALYSTSLVAVSIHAIHLELLLRKILQPNHDDPVLTRIFLITRVKILSSSTLLTLLVQRYDAQLAPDVDDLEFTAVTLPAIRSKLLSLLCAWLVGFYSDMDEAWCHPPAEVDSSCMASLVESARPTGESQTDDGSSDERGPVLLVRDVLRAWIDVLETRASEVSGELEDELAFVIQLARHKEAHAATEYIKQYDPRSFAQHIPPPLLPAELNSIKSVFDVSPVELARQLTLEDYKVFYSIRPADYLAKDSVPAESTQAYSARFNKVMTWFSSRILLAESWTERARLACKFIDVALCCRGLDNYFSMQAVIVALSSANISRLVRLFSMLPDTYREKLHDLETMMDVLGKFKIYRMRLKQTVAPCVPFIAPWLGDIISTDDAQDTFLEPNGLVNIDKLSIMAKAVDVLIKLRSPYAEYAIQPIEQVLALLQAGEVLDQTGGRARSLELQARGAKPKPGKPISYEDPTYDPSTLTKATFWNQPEGEPVLPDKLAAAASTSGFYDGAGGQFDANVVYTPESYPSPLASITPPPFELDPLLKLHPLEVARQLTLEDFDAFANVAPEAYVAYVVGGGKAESQPQVDELLTRYNYRVRWATSAVIGQEASAEHRAWTICFLLEVAHGAKLLNNFFTATAVLLGLQSPAIQRMTETWAAVPHAIKVQLRDKLLPLVDPTESFAAYFAAIDGMPAPLVPAIQIHLQVMTAQVTNAAADGSAEERASVLADHVPQLSAMSEFSYHLHRVEPIMAVINSIYVHNHANVSYARSLMLEDAPPPRGSFSAKPVPYERVLGNQPV
ncbi:uncharacterized protein AMSG_01521 [Thecamonas trahens ATCC 50062]|uniref:Uncharacterized protein n=1 Tax=Thecamonas trahens ATCC 50062 TaxID=461836 RepID=A0A0L0DQX2_THETB|nr:hypothetical protein AMSG_01521 [Thecamonas trahens ATCC 50062]KNC54670.1 hypothetical protein AMSG_01521 [Thecamonas trahens ATCC 50062]|eukprot:XP_013761572.1 hypothetical protein AMSG_01521 [Thecamonas trahens ATCC 50062]